MVRTEAEISKLLFDLADTDGGGSLDLPEFYLFVKVIFPTATLAEVQVMMESAGLNGQNKKISPDDLLQMIRSGVFASNAPETLAAFQAGLQRYGIRHLEELTDEVMEYTQVEITSDTRTPHEVVASRKAHYLRKYLPENEMFKLLFDMVDADKGGTIGSVELETLMRLINPKVTPQEVHAMMTLGGAVEDADSSEGPQLTFEQFHHLATTGALLGKTVPELITLFSSWLKEGMVEAVAAKVTAAGDAGWEENMGKAETELEQRKIEYQQRFEKQKDYEEQERRAMLHRRLTAFYARHNPEKLRDEFGIDTVVNCCKDEDYLFKVLHKKYKLDENGDPLSEKEKDEDANDNEILARYDDFLKELEENPNKYSEAEIERIQLKKQYNHQMEIAASFRRQQLKMERLLTQQANYFGNVREEYIISKGIQIDPVRWSEELKQHKAKVARLNVEKQVRDTRVRLENRQRWERVRASATEVNNKNYDLENNEIETRNQLLGEIKGVMETIAFHQKRCEEEIHQHDLLQKKLQLVRSVFQKPSNNFFSLGMMVGAYNSSTDNSESASLRQHNFTVKKSVMSLRKTCAGLLHQSLCQHHTEETCRLIVDGLVETKSAFKAQVENLVQKSTIRVKRVQDELQEKLHAITEECDRKLQEAQADVVRSHELFEELKSIISQTAIQNHAKSSALRETLKLDVSHQHHRLNGLENLIHEDQVSFVGKHSYAQHALMCTPTVNDTTPTQRPQNTSSPSAASFLRSRDEDPVASWNFHFPKNGQVKVGTVRAVAVVTAEGKVGGGGGEGILVAPGNSWTTTLKTQHGTTLRLTLSVNM